MMLSIVIIPLSFWFVLTLRVVREGNGLIRVVHVVVVEETVAAQFNSSVDDHPVTTAEYSAQTIHIS